MSVQGFHGLASFHVPKRSELNTPLCAAFPGVSAGKSCEFGLYENGEEVLFFGENELLEFEGRREGGEYVLGVLDHRSGQVRVIECPVYSMSRHVKKLRHTELVSQTTDLQNARSVLGNTFGTRKAQAQDRERQRGRIEVNEMLSSRVYLESQIQQKTHLLPSSEQIKALADGERPLPPFDAQADHVSGVYPLSFFDQAVWDDVQREVEQLKGLKREDWGMPIQSELLEEHLQKQIKEGQDVRSRVTLLAVFIRAFAEHAHRPVEFIQQRIRVSDLVFQFLVSTFTEDKKYTPRMEHKLAHWLAVCLLWAYPNFTVPVAAMARDEKVPVAKLSEIYKSCGCKIVPISKNEREAAGYTVQQAKDMKKAVLSVPLTFPADKRGKRK